MVVHRPIDDRQLRRLTTLLAAQTERLDPLFDLVKQSPGKAFVLNLQTNILHATRPGDGVHTACGWWIGGAARTSTRVGGSHKRGGISILSTSTGHPHQLMCEKCLQPERIAERLAIAPDLVSNSESD